MRIWVDADACPRVIREILFRAADRKRIELILVANHAIPTPQSRFVQRVRVAEGFDAADAYITAQAASGDLVITADVPLAAAIVDKGGLALDPRGQLYTEDNVSERLTMRDMMDELRSLRAVSGGPAALGPKDKQQFANQLDRLLAQARHEDSD